MRFFTCGILITIASVVCSLASAQEHWPGTFIWKPHTPIERKVGDELTHRGEINWLSKYKELALNQPRTYERTRKIAWDYTREVLAARKGKVSKDRVRINRWTWVEQDGLADNSLKAYTFEFRGIDSGRNRRVIRKGEEELSPQAKAWTEHHLRNFSERLFEALRPRRAHLKSGDEWEVDPLILSIALQLDQLSRVDPSKSKLTGRLGSTRLVKDVFVGEYVIEGHIRLGQLAYTQAPWSSGGTMRVKISVQGPLEPIAVVPYTIKISGVLKGAGEIQGASGETIKRELDWTMTGEWTRSLP